MSLRMLFAALCVVLAFAHVADARSMIPIQREKGVMKSLATVNDGVFRPNISRSYYVEVKTIIPGGDAQGRGATQLAYRLDNIEVQNITMQSNEFINFTLSPSVNDRYQFVIVSNVTNGNSTTNSTIYAGPWKYVAGGNNNYTWSPPSNTTSGTYYYACTNMTYMGANINVIANSTVPSWWTNSSSSGPTPTPIPGGDGNSTIPGGNNGTSNGTVTPPTNYDKVVQLAMTFTYSAAVVNTTAGASAFKTGLTGDISRASGIESSRVRNIAIKINVNYTSMVTAVFDIYPATGSGIYDAYTPTQVAADLIQQSRSSTSVLRSSPANVVTQNLNTAYAVDVRYTCSNGYSSTPCTASGTSSTTYVCVSTPTYTCAACALMPSLATIAFVALIALFNMFM